MSPPPFAAERAATLDVARGAGVLAIVAINIQGFAFPPSALGAPPLDGADASVETAIWAAARILFEMKAVTVLAAVFGASLAAAADRGDDVEADARARRRLGWLCAFGAAHALMLWFGDILMLYAVVATALFGLRHAEPPALWRAAAVAMAAFLAVLTLLATLVALDPAVMEDAAAADHELALYAAPFWTRWPETAAIAAGLQIAGVIVAGPGTAAAMVAGMAAYRSGLLAGAAPRRVYARGALLILPGMAGSAAAAWIALAGDFSGMAQIWAMVVLGPAAMVQAAGYLAGLAWLTRSGLRGPVARALATVGRLSLTNYLGCSVLGALIFYGPPGLGLVGRLDFVALAGLTLAAWTAMIGWSAAWRAAGLGAGPLERLLRAGIR